MQNKLGSVHTGKFPDLDHSQKVHTSKLPFRLGSERGSRRQSSQTFLYQSRAKPRYTLSTTGEVSPCQLVDQEVSFPPYPQCREVMCCWSPICLAHLFLNFSKAVTILHICRGPTPDKGQALNKCLFNSIERRESFFSAHRCREQQA